MKKYWWILRLFLLSLLWLFLSYPFYYLFSWIGFNEFMTVWIALGGIIGVAGNFVLTQRRITTQEKQIEEQREQFKAQIDIQNKQQRDARFASGVELLGNANESTRIGGAYNLYFLAKEYGNDYLEPVCEILCAHIRTITSGEDYQKKYIDKPSNEIQTILNFLFQKDKDGKLIFDTCKKNLQRTFLCGANFYSATLSNVLLPTAILNKSDFHNAKLNEVDFEKAKLNDVNFGVAKLNGVDFFKAEINEVYFDVAELNEVDFVSAELNVVIFDVAELNEVKFWVAKLIEVYFVSAELNEVDFSYAKQLEKINFSGTRLAGHSHGEITYPGRSLKLTEPEE